MNAGDRKADERAVALRRERRSQLRGLLILGALVLGWLIVRAQPLHPFGAGWWRFR